MPVSQSAPSSSIDLSALPAGVAEALAGLVAVCREPHASEPCAAALEEAELRVWASVNALCTPVVVQAGGISSEIDLPLVASAV